MPPRSETNDGAEGAHLFGALLLTFLLDEHSPGQAGSAYGLCQDAGGMRDSARKDDRRGTGENHRGKAADERSRRHIRT